MKYLSVDQARELIKSGGDRSGFAFPPSNIQALRGYGHSTNIFLDAFFNFGSLITFGGGNATQVTVALTRQNVAMSEKQVIVALGDTHQFTAT